MTNSCVLNLVKESCVLNLESAQKGILEVVVFVTSEGQVKYIVFLLRGHSKEAFPFLFIMALMVGQSDNEHGHHLHLA